LWFVIYSILGWVYETILCSVKQKRFINRGFLNGPYCPIYGCGAVLDILLLGKITNPVLLFLAAALLTGVLEYFTSFTMEKLFHARWWDYSDKKFNINGRVYLTGVIAFGIFSLVLILFLHPAVSTHTAILPETLRTAVAATLFSILLIDTIYTDS
jgi:Predicted membrane protein